jgi:hypothetical protein
MSIGIFQVLSAIHVVTDFPAHVVDPASMVAGGVNIKFPLIAFINDVKKACAL